MKRFTIKSIYGRPICHIVAVSKREAVINAVRNGISLEKADLKGIDLSNCGTIVDGNFMGACMSDIDARGTTFLRCDFRGTNLKYGNFVETFFRDCDLRKALFCGSDMRCTYYKNVKHVFDV